jgi:hypothetical protein
MEANLASIDQIKRTAIDMGLIFRPASPRRGADHGGVRRLEVEGHELRDRAFDGSFPGEVVGVGWGGVIWARRMVRLDRPGGPGRFCWGGHACHALHRRQRVGCCRHPEGVPGGPLDGGRVLTPSQDAATCPEAAG